MQFDSLNLLPYIRIHKAENPFRDFVKKMQPTPLILKHQIRLPNPNLKLLTIFKSFSLHDLFTRCKGNILCKEEVSTMSCCYFLSEKMFSVLMQIRLLIRFLVKSRKIKMVLGRFDLCHQKGFLLRISIQQELQRFLIYFPRQGLKSRSVRYHSHSPLISNLT